MLNEFKAFAMKGNVVDFAIGVIIGGAFGKVIESVVADLIMPLIGTLGKFDFSNLYINLISVPLPPGAGYADAKKLGPMLGYGQFITLIVNFLIIAWVLFLIVQAMNRMNKAQAAASAGPSDEVVLLTEIRDALKR